MKRGRRNIPPHWGNCQHTDVTDKTTNQGRGGQSPRPPPPHTPPHLPRASTLTLDSTMGFRQLCCVALCLLGIGESGVLHGLSSNPKPFPVAAATPSPLAFCLNSVLFSPAVSADPGITQIPKYLVMGMTDKKSLKCEQHLGHNAIYWYKQSSPEAARAHVHPQLHGTQWK